MARGPVKHMKRLNAPKHWMLAKMGGIFAPKPAAGPHKSRECLPISIVLRNRLKYALTRKESLMIVMQKAVKVDGKVRTELNFPAGFMDVIQVQSGENAAESMRLLYDTKGRFVLHKIGAAEAGYKLARVVSCALRWSRSRFLLFSRSSCFIPCFSLFLRCAMQNQEGTSSKGVPFVVTHDGRTLRYPDPLIKTHDTVKIDLASGKIVDSIKFETGNLVMITKGRNTGRVGVLLHRERHPGSFDIVQVKDERGAVFATRLQNAFVIGKGAELKNALVTLPKGKGVKKSIFEEREARASK